MFHQIRNHLQISTVTSDFFFLDLFFNPNEASSSIGGSRCTGVNDYIILLAKFIDNKKHICFEDADNGKLTKEISASQIKVYMIITLSQRETKLNLLVIIYNDFLFSIILPWGGVEMEGGSY